MTSEEVEVLAFLLDVNNQVLFGPRQPRQNDLRAVAVIDNQDNERRFKTLEAMNRCQLHNATVQVESELLRSTYLLVVLRILRSTDFSGWKRAERLLAVILRSPEMLVQALQNGFLR